MSRRRRAPLPRRLAAAAVAAGAAIVAQPSALGAWEIRLANGLEVLLGAAEPAPLVSEALLVVQAGSGYEGPGERGAAWVVAEAMIAGPIDASGEGVRRYFARNGVAIGLAVGREAAVYRFSMPVGRSLPFVVLLAELLGRPQLPAEAWAQARQRRLAVLQREEADPWLRASGRFASLAWPGGGGEATADEVARLETGVLEAFRRRHYSPQRSLLAVWGDPVPGAVEAAIRTHLGPLPPGAPRTALPAQRRAAPSGGAVECVPGGAPPILISGQGVPVRDDREFYGLQVLAQVLGGSQSSRLHRRLRLEEQIVYSVEARCLPVGTSGLTLQIASQTDRVERAREVMAEELARLGREEISDGELERAVAILRSQLLLDQESRRGDYHRRALARLSAEPVRGPEGAEALLAALTPTDLLALARRTLRPEALVTVVAAGDRKGCPPQREARIGGGS